MNDAERAIADFVATKGEEWKNLVLVACATDTKYIDKAASVLATTAKIGKTTLKRKIIAIHYARANGMGFEAIIDAGQKVILKKFVQEKVSARTLPLVAFPHRLTAPVRDALEETCKRIGRLLKLKTWDEVFEFIIADYATTTDGEILHKGGEGVHTTDSRGTRSNPCANRAGARQPGAD